MSSQYMQNGHDKFNRMLHTTWVNPSLLLVGVILISLGVLIIIVATGIMLLPINRQDNSRQLRAGGDQASVITEDVTNSKTEHLSGGVMNQQASDDNAKQQDSRTNNKIGVTVNGTPISVPENGSVNKHIYNQTDNSDTSVSITSQTDTTNTGDNNSSSTSISIQSSSSVESEGD